MTILKDCSYDSIVLVDCRNIVIEMLVANVMNVWSTKSILFSESLSRCEKQWQIDHEVWKIGKLLKFLLLFVLH